MRCVLTLFCALMILSACATAPTPPIYVPGHGDDMDHAALFRLQAPEALEESLFKEDQAVISNEDIARILSARITLPYDAKLAVIQFGQRPRWWFWSEEFTRMNEQIHADFIATLAGAERVREVAYLPSMVVPRQMTVPMLRQSAARFQASMFIVYRTASQTYSRQRFFSRDETRAYCTVEAILVDTRTGIIPFSTVITEHFSARRVREDVDFGETIARAEQQAIGRALLQLAQEVAQYLDTLPAAAPQAEDAPLAAP
jgi:hypothetical protein